MTYEPKTKSSFVKGDAGVADIYFDKNHVKVKVVLQLVKYNADGQKVTSEKSVILDRDACPEKLVPGKWMVNLSGQGDKMLSFRPVQGNFVVHTKEFASKENEEPKPATKEVSFEKGGKKQEYSYEYFVTILEILEPEKFKELEIPYTLRYNFEPEGLESDLVVAYSKGGSKYTDYLKEYLNTTGAWELGEMRWKDNLLPEFQRRILHADKKFQITMKEGWIVPGSLLGYDEPTQAEMIFDAAEADKALERVNSSTPEFDSEEILFSPEEETD